MQGCKAMRVTMRMLSLLRLATNVSAVPSGAQNTAICILPTAALGSANMRQNGGYRTPVIFRPSQRVTVIAVAGQSVMPRLRRSR